METFEWGALWGNPDLTMGVVSRPPEIPETPEGPDKWTIDIETTFTTVSTDPEYNSIYYQFDWGDGTDSGWVGPFASGQTGEATNIWTNLGDFQIKVRARDEYGVTCDWSEPFIISIFDNEPPDKATIEGPSSGAIKRQISFTISATDPEGHDVFFMINWGDGFYVPYTGPYTSGEEVTFKHAWQEPDDYTIAVKVKDGYGGKGQQSSFKIKVSNSRSVTNSILKEILDDFMHHLRFLNLIFEKLIWR